MTVRIQSEPFEAGDEIDCLTGDRTEIGAVVSFVGRVRSSADRPIEKMQIEHYPGMTEAAIEGMVAEASRRWQLIDCLVIHRYGELKPGEAIVLVATTSRHRSASFQAAEFLMDYLKTGAPFWKKEFSSDGASWVGNRAEDDSARERWRVSRG